MQFTELKPDETEPEMEARPRPPKQKENKSSRPTAAQKSKVRKTWEKNPDATPGQVHKASKTDLGIQTVRNWVYSWRKEG